MSGGGINRREFGKLLGAVSVARTVEPSGSVGSTQEAATARPIVDSYTFFTPEEAAFVRTALDHLIPADELGPGAREAGVAVFIDRQLAGAYGTAAKWYMQGPWGESVPEQGYQRPLAPQELYRVSIHEVNEVCRERFGDRFDRIAPEEQLRVLQQMERGELGGADAPIPEFFSMLLSNTMEGFFADPIYGGNRGKIGWRLVGFPGVGAAYRTRVGQFGEAYAVEPVSIEDVLERRARVDDHGHVEHEPRLPRSAQ
jgi:gluconate 2-dehydrogenase gamma chain